MEVISFRKAGAFIVILELKKGESYENAIEIVDEEILRFQGNRISDEELRGLKIKSYKNIISSLQTVEGISRSIGKYQTIYGDYKITFDEAKWQAVTKEKILEVSKKYLKKMRQSVAVFLPIEGE